jgi:hypothetical protein
MTEPTPNRQAELMAEKLMHALDLMRAEMRELLLNADKKISSLEGEMTRLHEAQAHQAKLAEQRLNRLEKDVQDHEDRIRTVTDGVTQFKVWSGLTVGGSGFVSVLALLRAWLGG